jgi:hypothetical protein
MMKMKLREILNSMNLSMKRRMRNMKKRKANILNLVSKEEMMISVRRDFHGVN